MLTLILKSLNACNLRCTYCSVGQKSCEKKLTQARMSEALAWFAAHARERGERYVTVIFHGGEPMLLPAQQYDHCIQRVQAQFPELNFRFTMQTNGTLLTPEYVALLRKYDIHVGVSIDGSWAVHDGQRKNISGQGTYEQVFTNIRTLQGKGVAVAALMVLTKPALTENLDFLLEFARLDIPLKINPLLSVGEAVGHPELALEPGEYGRYLARVLEYLAEHRLDLPVSPLDEILQNVLYQNARRGCQHSPNCHSSFLSVDPEGTIYPCGRFADAQENAIGTIETGITADGRRVLERLALRRTEQLPPPCRACRYLELCHGGCSADQPWSIAEVNPSTVCRDYQYIFHYIKTRGMELLRRQLLEERARLLSPARGDGVITDGI